MAHKKRFAGICVLAVIAAAIVVWSTRDGESTSHETGVRTETVGGQDVVATTRPMANAGSKAVASPIEKAEFTEAGLDQPSAPSTGRLAVRLVWEDDGSPAVGVRAWLGSPNGSAPSELDAVARPAGISDEDGRLPTWTAPVGPVMVETDRSHSSTALIVADKEAREEIRLTRGPDFAVSVVDLEDRPIADAEVWMGQGNEWRGAVIGKTDASGIFVAKSVAGTNIVAVRRAGFEPSTGKQVSGGSRKVVAVRFRLKPGGGSVVGGVRYADGRPAVGAVVRVGEFLAAPGEDGHDEWRSTPPPQRAFVDASGAFEFEGVPSGRQTLAVDVNDAPKLSSTVDVPPFGVGRCDFVLDESASIDGTLLDMAGAGAAGVVVKAIRTAGGTAVVAREATCGAGGRFTIVGLPVEEITLRADAGMNGSTLTKLQLVGGTSNRVELRLDRSRTIAGRVVDASGLPVDVAKVVASRKDKDGEKRDFEAYVFGNRDSATFAFHFDDAAPVTIGVFSMYGQQICIQENVVPGGPDLVLKGPESSRRSAFLKGRVIDALGAPAPRSVLWTHFAYRSSMRTYRIGELGDFVAGPMEAGRWIVEVQDEERIVHPFGTHDLRADETLDLGDLKLALPGSVVVMMRTQDGAPAESASCWIHTMDGRPIEDAGRKEGGRVKLAAGRYYVVADDPKRELQPIVRRFTIVGGAETLIEETFDAKRDEAGFIELRIEDGGPERADAARDVEVTVLDDGDAPLGNWRFAMFGTQTITTRLGRQLIRARAPDGRTAEEFVTVEPGWEARPKVVLRLR